MFYSFKGVRLKLRDKFSIRRKTYFSDNQQRNKNIYKT